MEKPKLFNHISIAEASAGDDFLPYKKEAQKLHALYDKYSEASFDVDSLQVNEPNEDLINGLLSSLNSLNELEFIIALKKIEKLGKFYPITINFDKDLSAHYKNFSKIVMALKNHSAFFDTVKMLESRIDNTSDDFISYINGFSNLLKYFHYQPQYLWNHLKHFRQNKYILNYSKPFYYLSWHVDDEGLFNELAAMGKATRTIEIEVLDFKTAKKICTFQIIINLELAENEYTESSFGIGFKPASIGYRYIKNEWLGKFDKALVDDFSKNARTYAPKDLFKWVSGILEEEKNSFQNMVEFDKYLIALHHKEAKKDIYKHSCKYKQQSHSKTCGNEFLSFEKKALFCYECTKKHNLSAQRTRIHREQKARSK